MLAQTIWPMLMLTKWQRIWIKNIKNINSKKIERASRHKSVCHSYSRARVKQIEEKLKNDGNRQYDSVILHAGTNDLAHADVNKVAKDMDDLLNEVKTHTKKVAVSNVIKKGMMVESIPKKLTSITIY